MQFQGLYTAIMTPFQKGGASIDFGAYGDLIEKQVEAGLAGVVPCGTTGESPTLSHEEHRELIQKTVELVNGRMAVIPGTGSNSTREAIELTTDACSMGVDAVMLVNPYYNKPSQEGLYQHFKAIAEKSTKPVVLYNIKGRTAVNIEPETIRRLVEIDTIQVKQDSFYEAVTQPVAPPVQQSTVAESAPTFVQNKSAPEPDPHVEMEDIPAEWKRAVVHAKIEEKAKAEEKYDDAIAAGNSAFRMCNDREDEELYDIEVGNIQAG